MKLMITGSPKSGKSTMLNELICDIAPRRGFITKEIVNHGHRTGFVIEDMDNMSASLAQTDNLTTLRVGRYYVQPEVIKEFTDKLSYIEADELLYVDEIGQMQLYSDEFKLLIKQYLDVPNDFVATITKVYSNAFTENILKRDDIVFFQLTEANRAEIKESLNIALKNRSMFNKLSAAHQAVVIDYAKKYISDGFYVSFGKLFNNSIKYFLENRVSKRSPSEYVVEGDTNKHVVIYKSRSNWSCDCPLSNGQEPFSIPMDCSHIQAVSLFFMNLKENKHHSLTDRTIAIG